MTGSVSIYKVKPGCGVALCIGKMIIKILQLELITIHRTEDNAAQRSVYLGVAVSTGGTGMHRIHS